MLSNGRRFCSLTIVDDYTREVIAIEVGFSLTSGRVIRVLSRLAERACLKGSNSTIFRSTAMLGWAARVEYQTAPGQPMQKRQHRELQQPLSRRSSLSIIVLQSAAALTSGARFPWMLSQPVSNTIQVLLRKQRKVHAVGNYCRRSPFYFRSCHAAMGQRGDNGPPLIVRSIIAMIYDEASLEVPICSAHL
jgi:transposase InsO family protein